VNRSLRINIVAIYLMGFFHSFMVVIPVFVPLLQGYGLSMSEVLQTQAFFALTVAILEVPSGYLADLWGRRRAILLGSLFNGVGFLSLLWADSFQDFLFYELMLGLGISLISGSDLALLYDTETALAERGEPGGAGPSKSLSRLISVEAGASGVAGITASVVLIHSDMATLVLLQALVGFIPFLLGLFLVESPRPPLVHAGHAANAKAIMRLLVFGKPVVLWTTLAIIAFGLLAVYVFWIYQKYWELQGVPVAWFGYIWAAFALVVSVSARYASALEAWLGWRRVLWIAAALPLLGIFGMAMSQGWIGVMFGLAVQLSRGLSLTLFYDALNRRVPGDFRATVNSLVSLGVRGMFILSGPVMGWSLDRYGITSTLLVLLAVFAPLFLLVIAGLSQRIRGEAVPSLEPQPAR